MITIQSVHPNNIIYKSLDEVPDTVTTILLSNTNVNVDNVTDGTIIKLITTNLVYNHIKLTYAPLYTLELKQTLVPTELESALGIVASDAQKEGRAFKVIVKDLEGNIIEDEQRLIELAEEIDSLFGFLFQNITLTLGVISFELFSSNDKNNTKVRNYEIF